MRLKYLPILLLLATTSFGLFAQENTWTQRSERSLSSSEIYRTLSLNEGKMRRALENTDQKTVVELPLPDGTNVEFVLTRNQVMASELTAKFPSIQSFDGISIDGSITAKVDFNGTAFYASVRTKNGLVYIDPDKREKPAFYRSYYAAEYKNNQDNPPLFEEPDLPNSGKSVQLKKVVDSGNQNKINTISGGQLRKYRIAIAANSRYSNFHGGTIASVLSAMVTTMNRVNSVYENDLSITMELVADNDQLIFLSAATDPYDGFSDPEDFLNENTSVINSAIGGSSYDIGHVFTTSSGGVASLGSVCTSRKALGTTGIGSPVGDPFDIDFVAHEIGHQFGGNHTFNGTQGSCSGGNRNGSTAYEPGSGTTILAYAGICGGDNLQNNSDPFFHSITLEEIVNFSTIGSGNNCPVITETGNTAPTIKVDETVYTIPVSTPFQLNAEGSDVNGDNLTYSWEQFDLGPAGGPGNPEGNAPTFRAFNPTQDSFRIFPRLESILNSTTIFGERLPNSERELNFRVVVRDNNPVGGAINTDDVKINVEDGESFRVTSQALTNTSYIGGSTQEVTWEVGNTANQPINTLFVKILLSTNGGASFDHILAESTENDGLAQLRIPEVVTNQARIKIEAIENVFFNINARNFSVTEAIEADYSIRVNPIPLSVCAPENAEFEVFVDGFGGFNEVVTLSSQGLDNALSINFQNNTILPGESTMITVSNTESASQSQNVFNIIGSSASVENRTREITLNILDGSTSIANLTAPVNGAINVSTIPTFSWQSSEIADSYRFELATDQAFQNIIFTRSSETNTTITLDFALEEGVQYFWRLAINNQCGTGDFVSADFRTEAFETTVNSLTDIGLSIFPESANTVMSTITISEEFIVDDLNLIGLDITHTYINDLTVILQSPAGTRLTIFDQICDSQDDILANFDDESLNSEIACPPANNSTFRPQNSLSVFDGENAQGDWILEVIDGAAQDGGTLNGWGLEIGTIVRQLNLMVTSLNPSETELEWVVLNPSSSISGFEIEQKRTGEEDFSKIADVSADATSFIVRDLDFETIYQFRVRATLGNDFGDYSNQSEILTVPPAPSNLQASINSADLLIITWTDNLETEEGFVLETSNSNTETFEVIATLDRNENSFILEDFEIDNGFFIRIKAFNETGESPYSEIFQFIIDNVDDPFEEINLFPNPGNNLVRIETGSSTEIQSIVVSDISGKTILVSSSKENRTEYTIDTSLLKSGIYLIRLQSGETIKTLRWVKE